MRASVCVCVRLCVCLCVPSGPSAIMLILCGMVPSSLGHAAAIKVVLLTLSMCLSTLVTGGALCNHLDISNSISGILCAIVAAALETHANTQRERERERERR